MDRPLRIHLKSKRGQYTVYDLSSGVLYLKTKHTEFTALVEDFNSFVNKQENFHPDNQALIMRILAQLEPDHRFKQTAMIVKHLIRSALTTSTRKIKYDGVEKDVQKDKDAANDYMDWLTEQDDLPF